MRAPYPNALVLPHPALSAQQAEQLCREHALRLAQDGRGNLRLLRCEPAPAHDAAREAQ